MTRRTRLGLAAIAAGVGVLGLLMLGSSVAQCLGPLGVTGIQCAKATGWFPTVGVGPPILAASLAFAVVIADPALVRPRTGVAVIAGILVGSAAYLAFRPTTWAGPTSTGDVISLALPLDISALALVAILGGLAGLAAMWALALARSRSVRSPAGR